MDPAESAALQLGLSDLDSLLPPPANPELRQRLQGMAHHACSQAIAQARHADPLLLETFSQARISQGLAAERGQTLAGLLAGNQPPLGETPNQFEHLRQLSADLGESRQRENVILHNRVAAYRRQLHRQLPHIASQIQTAAADYSQAEKRLKDFFGTSKGLWDLDPGQWRNIDWHHLEAAAEFAREWPQLQELARRLGRQWSDRPPEAAQPPAAAAHTIEWDRHDEHRTEDLGRSEITGLSQGRDLSLLPASEMALLADPDAEVLFYKRHAEGTLANLEYVTQTDRVRHYDTSRAVAPPPQALEQGPVIICTDSSGSMAGLPERAAKALTLALARTCLATGRGCYLIAFSTEIQCLDLSDPVAVLPSLLAFMAHSFHGGTDLRPALYRSLELLDNPAWVNADLLIISDFRVPKLMIKKSNLIDPIRKRHRARLHALSIAPVPPVDDLHIFDSHWHFRTGVKGEAIGMTASQFKEI